MAQKINYNMFGPAFIREAISPVIIQKSVNKAIQPRRMSGQMDQKPAKVFYTANIKDAQVNYGNQLGVYNVYLPIEVDIEVRMGFSKRYLLNVIAPFSLIVQTYAPLVLFFEYTPVQPSAVNVNGNAGGGDFIYKKVVEEVPKVIASEVNKALQASYHSRIIDILKSVNGNASINSESVRLPINTGSISPATEDINHLDELHKQAPSEIQPSSEKNDPLIENLFFESIEDIKANLSPLVNKVQRLDYMQFGIEFIRLVITAKRVEAEINKAIAQQRIQADIMEVEGHSVQYTAVLDPVKVTQTAFGQYHVVLNLRISLGVNIVGGWNEAWHIKAKVPFGFQLVPYANPLIAYLLFQPVIKQNIVIESKQQSWTGLAWDKVEKAVYQSLQDEVNKAVNDTNADRSINIVKQVAEAVRNSMVDLSSLDIVQEHLPTSEELKNFLTHSKEN